MKTRELVSEFLGTYMLVFCGTGAIVTNEVSGGTVTHLGIALTFGLIVAGMIYAIGEISGAHINPAVTIAFTVIGKFPIQKLLPYIVAQLLGAVLASATLKELFPDAITMGETLPSGTAMQSFYLELILTFILMYVIIHVSTNSKETGTMAGLAIGGIVALEAGFAGPICGASMNPARSIAPALVNANLNHLWLYIAAPIIGAVLAVLVYKFLTSEHTSKPSTNLKSPK